MTLELLKKKKFQRDESIDYIGSVLSRKWNDGFKIYLICLGSLSRGEYRALAKKFDTDVLATKSILGPWFNFISWIIPGSYVGAMKMHTDSSAWAKQVVELAGEGYVVLVMSDHSGIEHIVAKAVQSYSISTNLSRFYEHFDNLRICIINAEDHTSVDVETNLGNGD